MKFLILVFSGYVNDKTISSIVERQDFINP